MRRPSADGIGVGRARTASAAVALSILLVACGQHPPPAPPEYPGTLVAPAELRSPPGFGDAFAIEQRVRSESSQGTHEFRAVLQKREDTLLLVGLGPHGGRGFVLTQRGDDVSFESHIPAELPFPPRFMLLDVHRAFFRGLEGPLADGEHRGEMDGEEVVEQWRGGLLRERTFRRLDDRPPGLIRVTYEEGLGGEQPPEIVHLDNRWFGYQLTITTLSHQRLDETSGGESDDSP